MAKTEISTKRMAISKANAQMVAVVAVASFVTIFCLFAAKAAWGQNRYQARVTTAKETANKQLKVNLTAFTQLSASYAKFDGASSNIIGGLSNGSGDSDGKNSRIILDALPSSYDFPALASSLEKILTTNNVPIGSISGTDDQLTQQTNISSPTPTAVPIPFTLSVDSGNYDSVKKLVETLQRSIRPIQIDTLKITGGASNMSFTVGAHTYYQPSKDVDIKKKVIK